MTHTATATRSGYVALLGRPNVGKSTLLNRLLGEKLSITSAKPQTTRHAILGIKTLPDAQIVYVDTPGLHDDRRRAINRYMNRAASSALGYVDLAVLLVEAGHWGERDRLAAASLASFPGPVLLAINKIDRLADKTALLPFIERIRAERIHAERIRAERVHAERDFAAVVPLSARQNDNLDTLEREIVARLPVGEFLFAPDQLTTLSSRFLAAELIREKLVRLLRDELPYALTVEIERFEQDAQLLTIHALIWVERAGQKAIVIGERGATLKKVGEQARADLEKRFDCKVFLRTWVKVRAGWSDDERALHSFGYRAEP